MVRLCNRRNDELILCFALQMLRMCENVDRGNGIIVQKTSGWIKRIYDIRAAFSRACFVEDNKE